MLENFALNSSKCIFCKIFDRKDQRMLDNIGSKIFLKIFDRLRTKECLKICFELYQMHILQDI